MNEHIRRFRMLRSEGLLTAGRNLHEVIRQTALSPPPGTTDIKKPHELRPPGYSDELWMLFKQDAQAAGLKVRPDDERPEEERILDFDKSYLSSDRTRRVRVSGNFGNDDTFTCRITSVSVGDSFYELAVHKNGHIEALERRRGMADKKLKLKSKDINWIIESYFIFHESPSSKHGEQGAS